MTRQGRFAVRRAIAEWNRLAKNEWRIVDAKAFADACRQRYADTGYREIEMSFTQAMDGTAHLISF